MRHIVSLFQRTASLPAALIISLALVLVAQLNPSSGPNIATAQRPSRIVFHSNRDGNFEIYTMNADGTGVTRLTNHPESYRDAALSPDGSRIAFASNRDGNFQIYVMGVDGTNVTRLSNHRANDRSPSFNPDGTKIVFNSDRDGNDGIYVMSADGTGVTNLTKPPAYADLRPRYSPDGRKIAFMSLRHVPPFVPGQALPSLYFQVYVMNADGTGVMRVSNTTVSEGGPVFSPDGQKIMFTAERSRTSAEIFLMNVDGTGRTRLTDYAAETDGDDRR